MEGEENMQKNEGKKQDLYKTGQTKSVLDETGANLGQFFSLVLMVLTLEL